MTSSWETQPAHLVVCPHCEEPVTATQVGSVEDHNPENGPPSILALLKCIRCHQGFVVGREEYIDGWTDFFRVWPSDNRPLSKAVPEGLRRVHEEAKKCYDARAFTATVVMVRRTLEGVCVEQLDDPKKILFEGLKELQARNLIDGRLVEWAQALRVLGNEGAHYTGAEVSREDASDALAFSEALLDYMYVLTAKFNEFKTEKNDARGQKQCESQQ